VRLFFALAVVIAVMSGGDAWGSPEATAPDRSVSVTLQAGLFDSSPFLAVAIVLVALLLVVAHVLVFRRLGRESGLRKTLNERTKRLEEEIEERRRVEAALRESEAGLVLSQRIAKIGSWELDLETQALRWSKEAFRLFGQEPGRFKPTLSGFYSTVHREDRAMVRGMIERAMSSGERQMFDHRVALSDATVRSVREQAEVVTRDGKSMIAGTVQDITEQKRLEQKLRQAVKIEAVGRLAGGVAHEFNNILTVILGHIDLLLVDRGLSPEVVESLLRIRSSASHAVTITRELLAFGSRQFIQKERVDLSEIVRSVVHMLEPLLGEDVILEVRTPPDELLVEADLGMIEQAIVNLAINSRDAMPNGGRLMISTFTRLISPEDSVTHPESRPGYFVCLTVADTGCGMDEQTLSRLFEPFFTTKEIGKGSGLGLATTYGIVKQHDGWVEVHTRAHEGASFTVYLPALEEPEERVAKRRQESINLPF
jgi:PAS domain S-box-containing protein